MVYCRHDETVLDGGGTEVCQGCGARRHKSSYTWYRSDAGGGIYRNQEFDEKGPGKSDK